MSWRAPPAGVTKPRWRLDAHKHNRSNVCDTVRHSPNDSLSSAIRIIGWLPASLKVGGRKPCATCGKLKQHSLNVKSNAGRTPMESPMICAPRSLTSDNDCRPCGRDRCYPRREKKQFCAVCSTRGSYPQRPEMWSVRGSCGGGAGG